LITGINPGALLTVQGLCQNPGRRGLAYSSGPGEQKGMSHPLLGDGILKSVMGRCPTTSSRPVVSSF
jgi:hypothetical protein